MNTKRTQQFEFKFPLLIFRTRAFLYFFDKVGSFCLSRLASIIAVIIVPLVAIIALYLVFNSFFVLLSNPEAGEVIRDVGPGAYILLPGVNPLLPFIYGWIAIICAVAIHEVAHGVAARSLGLNVNSSGLLFFLFIPIGAFVEVDEEQLNRSRPTVSSRVLASGVAGNAVSAFLSLLLLLMIVSGLKPIIEGVYVYEVSREMPAEAAGILPGDVITSIDNVKINDIQDLREILNNKSPGDIVSVTVARGEKWKQKLTFKVNLTRDGNRTIMGVTVGNLIITEALKNYQKASLSNMFMYLIPPTLAPSIVPFSDSLAQFYTHWLDPYWHVLANMLYWLWFVNFNVAIFNALPIYPLDGGRIFQITIRSVKWLDKHETKIIIAVTAIMLTVILMSVVIPFIT
ncbi:MAG: site-2 protease family protein [Candidatus Bathyarchaeia archaeon]